MLAVEPPLDTRQLAIDGRRVMDHLGIAPGPQVGAILRELLERVLDDPQLNTEDQLLDLARELGVRRNQLYKWQETIELHGKGAFPGSGRRAAHEKQAEEIAQLKRQLRHVTEENEILKKAAAFFARELK